MAKNNENVESIEISADQLQSERQNTQNLHAKLEHLPFTKLYADFTRNIRIQKGANVFGTTFKADTYDTDTLMIQIIQLGYIRDYLTVSKKKDAKGEWIYEILRGFRRYDAARRIIQAGTNLNVIQSFERIPCMVYENLTREQEDALINDQTSKQFAACEVLKEVFRRFGNGESWQRIGLHLAPQLARATGAVGKDAEIARADTVSKKLEIVTKWLNTTLNQFWQGVYLYGGPQVRKWLFLTLADKDGLLKKEEFKAECPFPLTSQRWYSTKKDSVCLLAAIREDIKAGTWDAETGTGPQFEATVAILKDQYENPPGRNRKPGEEEAISGKEIQMMMVKDGRSLPLKQTLHSCLKDSPKYDLEQWDMEINAWYGKRESFQNNRGILPAPILELLSLAFDTSASIQDFDAKLASLAMSPETKGENNPADTSGKKKTAKVK